MGYRVDSPYRHLPYIDISTPEGLIDMSKTPIDLIGIDMKTGKQKKMKAFSKNPYKFDSDKVREIPIAQMGTIATGALNRGASSIANFAVRDFPPVIDQSPIDPLRLPDLDQQLDPWFGSNIKNPINPIRHIDPMQVSHTSQSDQLAAMNNLSRENPIKHIDNDFSKPDSIQNSKIDVNRITDPFAPKKKQTFDPYFMLRGMTTGASWLAGRAARNRQDQYWRDQASTLGQLAPANLEDYQPTPFNQYFQRGGLANKYKTFLTDWNNSPMGQQMLNASVLKDNPVGPDFKNADNIRNARNILINNADVNINKFKNYKKQLIKDFSPDDEDVKSTTGNSGIAGYYTPSDKDGIMSSITTDESSNLGTFRNPYIRYSGKNLPYAYAATIKPDIKTRIETHNHPSKRISDIEDTLIHELSHASDYGGFFMPLSDISKITDYAYYNREFPSGKPFMSIRPKKRLGEFQKYVADPTETRARLNSFRLAAKEQGIYDPFTQKITDLQLKRYKSSNEGYDPLQQLRTVYTDEQIIDLLNSVSKNDQVIDSVSEQAKYGGSTLLKFQDGGSIVDFLKSRGIDSSKAHRRILAEQLGIDRYDLSAEKNIEMLKYLRDNLAGPSMPFPTGPRSRAKTRPQPQPQPIDRTLLHDDYVPTGVLESSRNPISQRPMGIPQRQVQQKPTLRTEHVPFGMNESDRNRVAERPVGIPTTGKEPVNNPYKGTSPVSKKPLDISPFYDNFKEIQKSAIKPSNKNISQELIPYILKMAAANDGKFLITDKGKKRTYIGIVDKYGNIKVEKEFEVLTGRDDDPKLSLLSNEFFQKQSGATVPDKRVTPTGAFKMRRTKDIYGLPGAYLGNSGYAAHRTYPEEFKTRNPLYNDGNLANNATTWGCINCKDEDIKSINQFPIDSTYVIDTRLPYEENMKQLSRKLFKKGGLKEGDELEVSDEEIKRLKKLGYKFNII